MTLHTQGLKTLPRGQTFVSSNEAISFTLTDRVVAYGWMGVYQTAIGGGAKIIDKFSGTEEVTKSVHTNWDSAIQLEYEQGSSLN